MAPLKATELLVELHLMEGASVKPAIEAIALCLAEKTVFTLEGIPSYRAHEKSFSFRIGDFANVKI